MPLEGAGGAHRPVQLAQAKAVAGEADLAYKVAHASVLRWWCTNKVTTAQYLPRASFTSGRAS